MQNDREEIVIVAFLWATVLYLAWTLYSMAAVFSPHYDYGFYPDYEAWRRGPFFSDTILFLQLILLAILLRIVWLGAKKKKYTSQGLILFSCLILLNNIYFFLTTPITFKLAFPSMFFFERIEIIISLITIIIIEFFKKRNITTALIRSACIVVISACSVFLYRYEDPRFEYYKTGADFISDIRLKKITISNEFEVRYDNDNKQYTIVSDDGREYVSTNEDSNIPQDYKTIVSYLRDHNIRNITNTADYQELILFKQTPKRDYNVYMRYYWEGTNQAETNWAVVNMMSQWHIKKLKCSFPWDYYE